MSPLSAANSHDKKEGRPEKHPKRAREKKTSALASHFVPAYCLETPMALMVVCCGTPSYWYGRVLNSWETAKLQRPGRAQKKKISRESLEPRSSEWILCRHPPQISPLLSPSESNRVPGSALRPGAHDPGISEDSSGPNAFETETKAYV